MNAKSLDVVVTNSRKNNYQQETLSQKFWSGLNFIRAQAHKFM